MQPAKEEEVESWEQDEEVLFKDPKDAQIDKLLEMVTECFNPTTGTVQLPTLSHAQLKRASETLIFSAFPQAHKNKTWCEQTRSKVITCCVNGGTKSTPGPSMIFMTSEGNSLNGPTYWPPGHWLPFSMANWVYLSQT